MTFLLYYIHFSLHSKYDTVRFKFDARSYCTCEQGCSQPQTDARASTFQFNTLHDYLNYLVILFIRAFIKSCCWKSALHECIAIASYLS